MNSFMKEVNNAIETGQDINLSKYKLNFSSYPNNLLGRFDKVIPNGSSNQKVTLGYTMYSCLLSQDVNVELIFAADKNDDLNNAHLESISMSIDDGVFYVSDKENGSYYNLNVVKRYLPTFAKAKNIVDDMCNLSFILDDEIGGMSEEEFEREESVIISKLQELGKVRVMNVARLLRFGKFINKLTYTEEQCDILKDTEKTGLFFNIPVLDYLRSVKKEDIKGVVERELIDVNETNTYLAPSDVIKSASTKVIDDFLSSSYNTFDAYFKASEQNFFELSDASCKALPGLAEPSFIQNYLTNHPNGFMGKSEPVRLIFDDDEPIPEPKKTPEEKMKEWDSRPMTFVNLYSVVMTWNEKFAPGKSNYYSSGYTEKQFFEGPFKTPGKFHHYAFDMLVTFASALVHEAVYATGFENMSYVSSSRATVKKLYAMDEKDDFTELLKKYIETKRVYAERTGYPRSNYKVNDFMNRWLKKFGLGESLSFQLDEDGLGVKIRLHKSKDDRGSLLADEGYGITQLISIILQIETAILSAKNQKYNSNYGLAALDEYEENIFHYEENTIAIEEPEIHLHPNYQSKLAEMFVDAYTNYNIHFIIETHSEYLIRKMQTLAAKETIDADEISILYVYSPDVEQRPLYMPQVKSISVKADGRLTDSFGTGFFDEADNSAMELLTLKEQEV